MYKNETYSQCSYKSSGVCILYDLFIDGGLNKQWHLVLHVLHINGDSGCSCSAINGAVDRLNNEHILVLSLIV